MSNSRICLQCGKEISDNKITTCPFCNCIDLLEKNSYDSIILNYKNASNSAKQMFYNDPTFIKMMSYHPDLFKRELPKQTYHNTQPSQPTPTTSNIPKCPTCGSTNVEKISTAKKAFGFAMVGLFSSNLGKTMHCRNCGYKW